jgi:hypothetical protein
VPSVSVTTWPDNAAVVTATVLTGVAVSKTA